MTRIGDTFNFFHIELVCFFGERTEGIGEKTANLTKFETPLHMRIKLTTNN